MPQMPLRTSPITSLRSRDKLQWVNNVMDNGSSCLSKLWIQLFKLLCEDVWLNIHMIENLPASSVVLSIFIEELTDHWGKSVSDKCTSQVFDSTNTTRERRGVILSFAKEKGYKASAEFCLLWLHYESLPHIIFALYLMWWLMGCYLKTVVFFFIIS